VKTLKLYVNEDNSKQSALSHINYVKKIMVAIANAPTYFVPLAAVFLILGTDVSEAANFAGKLTSDELMALESGRLRKTTGRGEP
jgi:hypothetical protein